MGIGVHGIRKETSCQGRIGQWVPETGWGFLAQGLLPRRSEARGWMVEEWGVSRGVRDWAVGFGCAVPLGKVGEKTDLNKGYFVHLTVL